MKTPLEHLGFNVGDDRKLADWKQITSYFEHLSESDRMILKEYGTTTEGRPMIYAIISHPDNLAHIDKFQEIQAKLSDPRGLCQEEAEALIGQGKGVCMISCSIHATEVGGAQMSMELAYELMTRQDEDVMEILHNVIFLFVPSLNPDGLDMVVDWYRRTLGTKAEGTQQPYLYHKYVGHDNNRDWFMLTQVENRQTVTEIHNVWHPHIVHDQHQMGSNGHRFILPPFIDPYDPNVDTILRQEVAWLGTAMAAALTNQGKKGVATTVGFDAYSPSRAYQHYHGGVRILSEAASVKLATPIEIKQEDISGYGGGNAQHSTWNHPEPWEGGRWTLRDIVEYDKTVAFACLQHSAKYYKDWVRNFYRIHKKAVERTDAPYAFIIPAKQRDPYTAAEMLHVLELGLVEYEVAREDFTADGYAFKAGDVIIRTAQPYGAYAKTLLEKQIYPDLRLYPGGPPKRPYDLTAQTLPLQMGVQCQQINNEFEVDSDKLMESSVSLFSSCYAKQDKGLWHYIRPESNHAYKIVNQLLASGVTLFRLEKEVNTLPAGTFIVKDAEVEIIPGVTGKTNPLYGCLKMMDHMPKVGLYKAHAASADEGWTRFILEEYGFEFDNITNDQIDEEYLNQYDTIILPQNRIKRMVEGLPKEYPDVYRGGLQDREMKVLLAYVKQGGTLLAFDSVCDYVIDKFYLPVKNVVADLSGDQFFIPGSFLRTVLDISHPLTYGLERETSILFLRSPVFQVKGAADVVGVYPSQSTLLSGWILGEEYLNDKANLVDVPVGKGHVVLYGMRPQFRAQARGTYKLVFNAILNSTLK